MISALSVWVAIAEIMAWSYEGGSAAAPVRSTTDWYLGGGIDADGGDGWFAE